MEQARPSHGPGRLYRASLNTFRGLKFAARNEAALREELVLLMVSVPLGFFIAPNVAWYVAMIGVLLVVLAIELLNTAVEKLADHVTPGFHPKIGVVKDVGSAAVFCGIALACLIWGAAALERFGVLERTQALIGS